MRLDTRKFSQEAYDGLNQIKSKLNVGDRKKASGLVQGLTAYISTWGLHRLSGDMKKFLNGNASDTRYKGIVYQIFLTRLRDFSHQDFIIDVNDRNIEQTLIHLPLRHYTALNHLAIQLAKEWSFWAAAVLGEAEG
jgi:hypothetical protein